jgi:hypothetical protein
MKMKLMIAFVLLAVTVGSTHSAEYSAAVEQQFPRNLYWGDLHVHSNLSPDSYSFGNNRLSPDDAYRFANGEPIVAANGMTAQLRRPLDFLMVADHAEFLGVFVKLDEHDEDLLDTVLGQRWEAFRKSDNPRQVMLEFVRFIQDPNYVHELPENFRRSVWQQAAQAAERHNSPGKFTAFVGYEWTSMVEGNNLHRVVVFRDDAEKATTFAPFSSLDSQDPEDLWAWLADYEKQTDGQVLAIAHNGNLSNGLMFSDKTLSGEPLTADYAKRRSRWEPLYEVTQVKGDGEAHPFLSPDDEFADYETWDEDNIGRVNAKQPWMLAQEYARGALKRGLALEAKLGGNPYSFGLIGSTDSHTAFATADDDNFWGKFPDSEPSENRTSNSMGGRLWYNWKLAASGYAAVWARENTREALFDAMRKKEVYATTGPRIGLRFFGGWEFTDEDRYAPDLAAVGYAKGVAMGSNLALKQGNAPTFLMSALRDPEGANLDRVQVIKGWLDEDGDLHEKVYNVALSDGRSMDNPVAVGTTVDVADASYDNSIGAAELSAAWVDPDFDASQSAFYYVRVLEIPTPRWTAYDAKYFKLKNVDHIPMVTTERVYSSPIWYKPTH